MNELGEVTPIIEGEEPPVEPIEPPEEPPIEPGEEEPPVEPPVEPGEEVPKLTLEELAERLDKSEKRVGFLTRKMSRPGQVPEKVEPLKAKPIEDAFETHAEFVEALTDWKVDERVTVQAEARAKQEAQNRQEDFFAVIDSGVETYPDFNEVARKLPADGGPTITAPMLEAMTEADNPVDIAYWLGQNVGESRRIASMTPLAAAREIGKLEAGLMGKGKPLPQKIKTNPVTPIKPLVGKTVVEKDLSDLPIDDFMNSRNKRDGIA